MKRGPTGVTPRPRDAAATRTAIMTAARVAFSSQTYNEVGLRDIARRAGVNVALINRYYGSKEDLFKELLSHEFAFGKIMPADKEQFGQALADKLWGPLMRDQELNSLLIFTHSASSVVAAPMIRQALQDNFIGPLAQYIGGDMAMERATILAAHLLGLASLRFIVQSETLQSCTPQLKSLLAEWLQASVTCQGTNCD